MSKHIQELAQAEDFFSDEDESLILSTDGKKNISTISDNK